MVLCLIGARLGLGEHEETLGNTEAEVDQKVKNITKLLYGSYIAYALAITFTKCSIIGAYLRLFPDIMFRRLVKATGVIVVGLCVCSIFIVAFECTPVYEVWDSLAENRKCINIVAFFYTTSAITLLTDMFLFCVPIPLFVRMQMPLAKRVTISVLFGLAAL